DHSRFRRSQREITRSSKMIAVAGYAEAQPAIPGEVDGLVHRSHGDHMPQSVITIQKRCLAPLVHRYDIRLRICGPTLEPWNVDWQAKNPVRVRPSKIRLKQASRNDRSITCRDVRGTKQGLTEIQKPFGSHFDHLEIFFIFRKQAVAAHE